MSDRSRRSRRRNTGQEKRLLSAPQLPYECVTGELLESPAFRVLSRAAQMCFWRICIAQIYTARHENGRLAVSYDQFNDYGVNRKMIKAALGELEAVGLVRRERQGRRAHGSLPGVAAEYRLTFAATIEGERPGPPTDEWRRLQTLDAARAAIDAYQKQRPVKPAETEHRKSNVTPLPLAA